MNEGELLRNIFFLLEQLCCEIVIKDFSGFTNWNNSLGRAMLPYAGHHAAFCSAVKQNSKAFAKCIRCSRVHQRLCEKYRHAFVTPCRLGLSEYSVPIVVENVCIGSLSAGLWCADPDSSRRKLLDLISDYQMGEKLLQLHEELLQTPPLPQQQRSVVDFIALLLGELFRPFVQETEHSSGKKQSADKGINTILTHIRSNYTDPAISVKSIAKACNYSTSYVSHTFSRYMNMNLRAYINHLRIILAKHELVTGNSVSMTAMICGFNDANYFTTVFRNVVGISASQYARTVGGREKPESDILPLPVDSGIEKRKTADNYIK